MAIPTLVRDADAVGQMFIGALARQDWAGLEACFGRDVQFRALTPNGLREATGAEPAAKYLRRWFGDADQMLLEASDVQPVQDRTRITYRFREHEDRWYEVEQQAYFTIKDDAIDRMDLLCSGFHPVPNTRPA